MSSWEWSDTSGRWEQWAGEGSAMWAPEAVPWQAASSNSEWPEAVPWQRRGKAMGWRRRVNTWTGAVYWNIKRARHTERTETPAHRTGAAEPTGRFLALVEEARREGIGVDFVLHTRWPVHIMNYVADDEVRRCAEREDLVKHLDNPNQAGLPLLYFQLHSAACGVLFKLRGPGTNNTDSALTLVGPFTEVEEVYRKFYAYTLQCFPHLDTSLPLQPAIQETTTAMELCPWVPDEPEEEAETVPDWAPDSEPEELDARDVPEEPDARNEPEEPEARDVPHEPEARDVPEEPEARTEQGEPDQLEEPGPAMGGAGDCVPVPALEEEPQAEMGREGGSGGCALVAPRCRKYRRHALGRWLMDKVTTCFKCES